MRRYPFLTPSPALTRKAAPAVTVYATYALQSIREGSLTTIFESEQEFYVLEVYHSPFFWQRAHWLYNEFRDNPIEVRL